MTIELRTAIHPSLQSRTVFVTGGNATGVARPGYRWSGGSWWSARFRSARRSSNSSRTSSLSQASKRQATQALIESAEKDVRDAAAMVLSHR